MKFNNFKKIISIYLYFCIIMESLLLTGYYLYNPVKLNKTIEVEAHPLILTYQPNITNQHNITYVPNITYQPNITYVPNITYQPNITYVPNITYYFPIRFITISKNSLYPLQKIDFPIKSIDMNFTYQLFQKKNIKVSKEFHNNGDNCIDIIKSINWYYLLPSLIFLF